MMTPLQKTLFCFPAVVSLFLCILRGAAGENLALGKKAWQSSMKRLPTKPYAGKAVDGNDDSNFKGSSCTHTKPEAQPWWVVDLGDVFQISTVTITNRGDCCDERLRDFNIALMSSPPNEVTPAPEVYDVIFHQTDALGAGETRVFATDNTPSGRYLVIQLLGDSDPLTLCEVQVTEHQAAICEGTSDNMALGQPTWQTDTFTWYDVAEEAAHAVDGKLDADFAGDSCTQTLETNMPWWVVDLGDNYRVYDVAILNRGDCCGERLHDFNIGLMSSPPGERVIIAPNVYDVIYHQAEAVPDGGMFIARSTDDTVSGRYMVIQLLGDSDPLTLCEVSVRVCGESAS